MLILWQLFRSKEFECGEEALTIAAMTAVSDIFVIPYGAPGALAELERRKFTAEEGASLSLVFKELHPAHAILFQDHLTLLNGMGQSHATDAISTILSAYNAFTKYGKSAGWCKSHAMSFRAMSRAVSIRSQLKRYMQRFGLPLQSCMGDATRLRQCLVSAYWRNGAKWVADGTYRSVRGERVST